MMIFPAVDIQGGRVVRLLQGDFSSETVYAQDPVATARHWVEQGAAYLHVVDLDGAKTGTVQHSPIIQRIVQEVAPRGARVQVGGGIRDFETVAHLLAAGVSRVVLGTRAFRDPAFRRRALEEYGDRVAISVDAQHGLVATEGWQNIRGMLQGAREDADTAFVADLLADGARTIIYTDITKDGTLTGPAFERVQRLMDQVRGRAEVVASGGVGSLEDLRRLKQLGVHGAIVGKALYERRFTLPDALAL